MICPYCKVEITYNTESCPLCHMPLNKGANKEDISSSVYPKKLKAKKLFSASFEKIYIYCAIYVFALSVLLNIRFLPQFPWSAIVAIFLISGLLIFKQVYISKSRLKIKKGYPNIRFCQFLKRFFHL